MANFVEGFSVVRVYIYILYKTQKMQRKCFMVFYQSSVRINEAPCEYIYIYIYTGVVLARYWRGTSAILARYWPTRIAQFTIWVYTYILYTIYIDLLNKPILIN